ncbi:hypothetical protein ELE36_19685 [Pseudolysobacter antarcticus]|uniref:Uncharacterized protein n=1 Tax=Pseudolysobacter antarcticus TaxID=2511995 RepID=A0A411HPI6_9GAMM|nr:hypothetical protein [Pseudolysobacter antarcticus]QBB72411.1 hypothetical protein ELE36_19685 [Pseudolysobacter antarcticus]
MMPRELTLTTIGLSLHDDLLIKSLLQIVNARTRDRWHFRDDMESDVALCDPESALVPLVQKHAQRNGSPRCISLVHEGLEPIRGTSVLAAPVRAADFIAMLDSVSSGLTTSAHASSASPRGDAIGTNSISSQPPSFGLLMHDLFAQASNDVYRIDSANVTLHVIPATRVWLLVQPLEEDDITQLLRSPPDLTLTRLSRDHAQRLLADDRINPYPVESLLWRAGLQGAQDRLLPGLPHDARFALRRWPDFGRLKHEQAHFRMAALLTRAPHDLDELANTSAQTHELARGFINACALCDLITVRPPASRATTVSATAASFDRPSSRYAGIFRSIRGALGFLQSSG